MPIIFLLFILIPIVEITLLINVGQAIGAWYTVGLVVLSAFVGVNMLRYQGISTLARAQQRMNAGELPGEEMVEGIVLAVGGALLITPGFVTDTLGFCCLIPVTRKALVRVLMSRFTLVAMGKRPSASPESQEQPFTSHRETFSHRASQPHKGEVIDGEYRRED